LQPRIERAEQVPVEVGGQVFVCSRQCRLAHHAVPEVVVQLVIAGE
jgi:hypothetical protein